jgi:hypothetical protein
MFGEGQGDPEHRQGFRRKTFFFSFFVVLGLELRAYILSHSTNPFVMDFFEIGSLELFALAGFEQ